MKPAITILSFAFTAFVFTACGDNNLANHMNNYSDSIALADSLAEWGTPAAMDFTKLKDPALDGKRVVIEGYVGIGMYASNGMFYLYERKGQFAGDEMGIHLEDGTGKNTMKDLPDKFTHDDIVITGNSGEKIGFGDHVRVTGICRYHSTGSSTISTQLVEKIDDAAYDYAGSAAVKIDASNANDTSLIGKLVYVEGILDIPTYINGNDVDFNITIAGLSNNTEVTVNTGTGANLVEELPDGFTPADFKVHGFDNSIINLKKKVRVYGVWTSMDLSSGKKFWLKAEHIQQI
jgi:hypothetical protein